MERELSELSIRFYVSLLHQLSTLHGTSHVSSRLPCYARVIGALPIFHSCHPPAPLAPRPTSNTLDTKVVTVQSDPGGSGVGNVYRLGWKENCVDDDDDLCEVRSDAFMDDHHTHALYPRTDHSPFI